MMVSRRRVLKGGLGVLVAGPGLAQTRESLIGVARQEKGVIVYGTMRPANWEPVLAALAQVYPWLKVQALRIDLNNQIFDRYLAEAASGTRTADLLIASALDRWQTFVDAGNVIDFEPATLAGLPAFAAPRPGLFALSVEPLVMLANKALLPPALLPTGLADLADKVQANPGSFRGKVACYDPTVSTFGLSVFWGLAQYHGEAFWAMLRQLAPALRFEGTTGAMLDKVSTGEYVAALFVTEALLPPMEGARARIVQASTLDDGEPMFPRGMGVTKAATSPASAKLFVDFLLSTAGQTALGKGGLAPFNPGVDPASVKRTYQSVVKAVGGEKQVIVLDYDAGVITQAKPFVARIRSALGLPP